MVKPVKTAGVKAPKLTTWLWVIGFFAFWALFSAPSLLILSLGMLPTLVAYFCDRTEQKYALFCVGGLNFCGTFPFLLKLNEDHTIAAAVDIMGDVFSLAIIFSAAGFGWLMFMSIPPVVASFLTVLADSRVKMLRGIQKRIVEEWGTDVSVDKDKTEAENGGTTADNQLTSQPPPAPVPVQ